MNLQVAKQNAPKPCVTQKEHLAQLIVRGKEIFLFPSVINAYYFKRVSFLTTVIWKPVFSIQPEDVVEEEGRDVNFKCGATGFPRPEINWLRNNSLLSNATLTQNGSISYLVLRSVRKEQNAGMYHCEAVNLAGRTLSKAGMLTVTPKVADITTVGAFPRDGKFCYVIS